MISNLCCFSSSLRTKCGFMPFEMQTTYLKKITGIRRKKFKLQFQQKSLCWFDDGDQLELHALQTTMIIRGSFVENILPRQPFSSSTSTIYIIHKRFLYLYVFVCAYVDSLVYRMGEVNQKKTFLKKKTLMANETISPLHGKCHQKFPYFLDFP